MLDAGLLSAYGDGGDTERMKELYEEAFDRSSRDTEGSLSIPQFLALLEPSLDGLERILRACEPVHRSVSNLPIHLTFFSLIVIKWAKLIGTPITGQRGQPRVLLAERRALVLRGLSRALRTWTDATVAVDYFFKWLQILGETPKLVEFTRNWEDSKASAFATAYAAACARRRGARQARLATTLRHRALRPTTEPTRVSARCVAFS